MLSGGYWWFPSEIPNDRYDDDYVCNSGYRSEELPYSFAYLYFSHVLLTGIVELNLTGGFKFVLWKNRWISYITRAIPHRTVFERCEFQCRGIDKITWITVFKSLPETYFTSANIRTASILYIKKVVEINVKHEYIEISFSVLEQE